MSKISLLLGTKVVSVQWRAITFRLWPLLLLLLTSVFCFWILFLYFFPFSSLPLSFLSSPFFLFFIPVNLEQIWKRLFPEKNPQYKQSPICKELESKEAFNEYTVFCSGSSAVVVIAMSESWLPLLVCKLIEKTDHTGVTVTWNYLSVLATRSRFLNLSVRKVKVILLKTSLSFPNIRNDGLY